MSNTDQPVPAALPRVTVLLATFNGERWLDEQLDTILSQQDVTLRVIARDDGSSDKTTAILARRAAADPRLEILPSSEATGSAAGNFYRLLRAVPGDNTDFVAFADQDDLWRPDKLSHHASLATELLLDGISSDVVAMNADGTTALIRKSYPQRRFDYLLESAGPGCTFMLSPRLVQLMQQLLSADNTPAASVHFHDWLVYAVCRARGWNWRIDAIPSVDYRQHDSNVIGANIGVEPARRRLRLISQRWHREQAALLAEVALHVAPPDQRERLERMKRLLGDRGVRARIALLRQAGQLRRRPRDRAIIATLVFLGIW